MNMQITTQGPLIRVEGCTYAAPGRFIRETVCKHAGYSLDDICSKRRDRPVTRARQIGMALTRKYTALSNLETAKLYNRVDHTTVCYAVRTISTLIKREEDTAEIYRAVDEEVAKHFAGKRSQTELDLAWGVCSPDRIAELQHALGLLGYDMTITPRQIEGA